MMSTYELVIAFLSTTSIMSSSSSSSSTTEVTTVQTKKVLLNHVDSEANAAIEAEL
jgi:hypothetical protein